MLQANDVVVCVPALHLSKQYAESVLFCPKNKWNRNIPSERGRWNQKQHTKLKSCLAPRYKMPIHFIIVNNVLNIN